MLVGLRIPRQQALVREQAKLRRLYLGQQPEDVRKAVVGVSIKLGNGGPLALRLRQPFGSHQHAVGHGVEAKIHLATLGEHLPQHIAPLAAGRVWCVHPQQQVTGGVGRQQAQQPLGVNTAALELVHTAVQKNTGLQCLRQRFLGGLVLRHI